MMLKRKASSSRLMILGDDVGSRALQDAVVQLNLSVIVYRESRVLRKKATAAVRIMVAPEGTSNS